MSSHKKLFELSYVAKSASCQNEKNNVRQHETLEYFTCEISPVGPVSYASAKKCERRKKTEQNILIGEIKTNSTRNVNRKYINWERFWKQKK